jgi:hypothetical protein
MVNRSFILFKFHNTFVHIQIPYLWVMFHHESTSCATLFHKQSTLLTGPLNVTIDIKRCLYNFSSWSQSFGPAIKAENAIETKTKSQMQIYLLTSLMAALLTVAAPSLARISCSGLYGDRRQASDFSFKCVCKSVALVWDATYTGGGKCVCPIKGQVWNATKGKCLKKLQIHGTYPTSRPHLYIGCLLCLILRWITRLLERARQTILWIQLKARHTP